jgi:hypothetical protein
MYFEKEVYDQEYEKANNCKDAISQYEEDWVNCYPENLKLGDIVYVEYFPDSQKYIYTHCPEYGLIEEINEEEYQHPVNGNTFKEMYIKILNHNGQIVNLNKDHLSIYSKGYYMNIKKYELNHPSTPKIDNYSACCICNDEHH